MGTVITDARNWQNVFDLETGDKISDSSSTAEMLSSVLSSHPYPGDREKNTNRWVSDTALDLISRYNPSLACLIYSGQYFSMRYADTSDQECAELISQALEEARYFKEKSGFTPLIIGSGNLISLKGEIDLTGISGIAITSNWTTGYAGLHSVSEQDLEYLKTHPQISRIASREEWISQFPELSFSIDRVPDYLLSARPGWIFKAIGSSSRRMYRIPDPSEFIPYSCSFGRSDNITDFHELILSGLEKEKKIALIILEGIGISDFPEPFLKSCNRQGWFVYEPGGNQYLTITTGNHRVFSYPAGYSYYLENSTGKKFPYSGYFNEMPSDTLGEKFSGRSIAVGNRSMLTHAVFGADLCVECFARSLYNQGTMGVIHRNRSV